MKRKKFTFAILSLLALLTCLPALVSAQKNSVSKAARDYQNRQRALSLILFDSKIKSLDDAPVRCYARIELLEAVLEQGVYDFSMQSIFLADDCLEEIERWPEEFEPGESSKSKASLLQVLRKFVPAEAKRLEREGRFSDSDLDDADERVLLYGGDLEGPFNRLLQRLRSGEIPVNTAIFISRLREIDQEMALALMSEVLSVYESRAGNFAFENSLVFLVHEYLSEKTPVALKQRFLRFVVNVSSLSIQNRDNQFLRSLVRNLLQSTMPHFSSAAPELRDNALALKATIDARLSESERELGEINERIAQSEDKLAQTIEEAKKTEIEAFRNQLWQNASRLAVRKSKFTLAVDLILEIDATPVKFGSTLIDMRQSFIKQTIVPAAIKEDDIKAALYAYDRMEKETDKSEALILIAGHFARNGDPAVALDYLDRALDLLEKVEPSALKLSLLSRCFAVAVEVDEKNLERIAGIVVKTINGLPDPAAEDIKGSAGRREYVKTVVVSSAINVSEIFSYLAKSNFEMASFYAPSIRRGDLRLMAEISVEKHRKYPLPKEEER